MRQPVPKMKLTCRNAAQQRVPHMKLTCGNACSPYETYLRECLRQRVPKMKLTCRNAAQQRVPHMKLTCRNACSPDEIYLPECSAAASTTPLSAAPANDQMPTWPLFQYESIVRTIVPAHIKAISSSPAGFNKTDLQFR